MILSSKSFTLPADINEVVSWLEHVNFSDGKAVLNMTIEILNKRSGKGSKLKELSQLVEETGNKFVKFLDIYEFNFDNNTYFWNSKEVYLTANEQLYLFKLLVLKETLGRQQRHYLWNMRKRLGKDFLIELTKESADHGDTANNDV